MLENLYFIRVWAVTYDVNKKGYSNLKSGYQGDDMTEHRLNEYRSLLDSLKRNKENVPLETLKTKYSKPYEQLTKSIQSMTREILQEVALNGLQIERADADQRYQEINTAISGSGIMKKISQAAFIQQDADLVLEYAGQLREIVHGIVKGCEKNAS